MTPITTFSTKRDWLSRVHISSQLIADGRPTGRRILGYDLRAQFRVGDRYLLITDGDCPFEETTHFTLINEHLKRLYRVRRSVMVTDIVPSSETSVSMNSGGPYVLTVTVHEKPKGVLRRLITLKEEKSTEQCNRP
jgi:hypothetical protein